MALLTPQSPMAKDLLGPPWLSAVVLLLQSTFSNIPLLFCSATAFLVFLSFHLSRSVVQMQTAYLQYLTLCT